MVTTVQRIAGWAADVTLEDVPVSVVELCRAQRRSLLGALAAASVDPATRRVLGAVDALAADGPVDIPGVDRALRVDDAIYAAAVSSIALDFDDYLCFAHTGHSATAVPILMAAETAGSGPNQILAQVVANEVEARLGGACLVGPLNGQMWSFVHAAGAALSAGLMLGLGTQTLAHALAIALYQAPRPTVAGFMGPDSKLLTAAEPALMGVRAARLAAAGVTGPLDVLDHPQGFFAAFSYAPLPAILGSLGEGWATQTLSIKRYPGCAYIDTALDALAQLGPPSAEEVASVRLDAGVLTCEMDALSRPYTQSGVPSAVAVTFSARWSVAAALLSGRLTPAETNEHWLVSNRAQLLTLVERTQLCHDWGYTARSASSMAPLLPPRALVTGASSGRLMAGLRRARRDHPGIKLDLGAGLAMAGLLRGTSRSQLAMLRSGQLWDPDVLAGFTMSFPARVTLTLADGAQVSAEADVPLGAAGNPTVSPELASREKLTDWGPTAWGQARTEQIAKAVDTDDDRLWELLGAAC